MSELKNEILNSNYVPVSEIDPELVPSHVVLYLKNKSTIDKKIIVDPISLQQILLSNQNPSLRLIDSKAVFCLSSPSEEISCEGATSTAILKIAWEYREQVWDVILNGQLFRDLVTSDTVTTSSSLASIFNTVALGAASQSLALEVYWNSSHEVTFYNQGENLIRIILVPKNQAAREDVNVSQYNENPTVYKDDVTNEISFCLSPSA